MRNFGLLKSIVENALVKTYKTEDFKQIIKEFRDWRRMLFYIIIKVATAYYLQ